jgi:tetratricopeptide (TPR) repeat protein
MVLTVALIATLALAAPAGNPSDVAALRAQSDALYASGDYHGSLEAAQQAQAIDRNDPWSRYAWVRALAAIDKDAARAALPGLQNPAALEAMSSEDRARLDTALGYLCLDLGVDPLAAMHFNQVPTGSQSHPQAQAGLAIVSVRRGHSRQALVYFVAARASGKLDPSLAELERETRFQVVLHEFGTARDLRDVNAAGRAYAALDELRPHHPLTLRARADIAALRGDAPALERALRELLDVDRRAPGAASELVDTLLVQNRPHDALMVARDLAPDRLAGDSGLQSIERSWVPHLDIAMGGQWHDGRTPHDRLSSSQLHLAWTGSSNRFGRFRLAANAFAPDSAAVAAGNPFGSAVALPFRVDPSTDQGLAAQLQWAPTTRFLLEVGHTPTAFEVSNLTGAMRFRLATAEGPWTFGIERQAVAESLLSFAGAIDPLTGREWGGVTSNRAYLGGNFGGEDLTLYGMLSSAIVDGKGVDDNTQWEAEAGFWKRTRSGERWSARLGANLKALGYDDNRSHFTLGHGGYFSPRKFLSAGPTFDLRGGREAITFRLEGGIAWQAVRESSSEYFPVDDLLQAAGGDLHYPGDSREGLGARIAASVEWRVSNRSVAGVRLEGARGEDFDEVRLQVYTRRWSSGITEPLRARPPSLLPPESYELN